MKNLIISDDLKQHMTNSPGKAKVWVNDAGEWSNHKDAKYPHELSRSEILKGKSDKKEDDGEGGKGEKTTEKNTTDPKISVKVTAKNKATMPPGSKVGDVVEVDNPDYIDPLS